MQEGENKALNRKYLERIQKLRLLDDDFFAVCFADDIECTQLVLRILLGKEDLQVISAKTQYNIKNLRGHDVILDAFATDSEDAVYNIEIQRSNHGATPKRARYYSSLIDANRLSQGSGYTVLPETYVIFITENDFFQKGLPIYHIERRILETDEGFQDGSYIVYVNAAAAEDTELGRLMHDFRCANPADMNYPLLANKTKRNYSVTSENRP